MQEMQNDIKNKSRIWCITLLVACIIPYTYLIFSLIFEINEELLQRFYSIKHTLHNIVSVLSFTATEWMCYTKYPTLGKILAYVALSGVLLITISPFYGGSIITADYISILENIIFILGFSLFIVASLLFAIANVTVIKLDPRGIGNIFSIIMYLASGICLIISYFKLQIIVDIATIDIQYYYKLLFWETKYLLRFLYTHVVLILILIFTNNLGGSLKLGKIYIFLVILNFGFNIAGMLKTLYDIILYQ